MSYLGTTKIGKIYLGSTALGKVYLGSDLVYQTGGGPTPPPGPIPAGAIACEMVFSDGYGAYIPTSIVPLPTMSFEGELLYVLPDNTFIAPFGYNINSHRYSPVMFENRRLQVGYNGWYWGDATIYPYVIRLKLEAVVTPSSTTINYYLPDGTLYDSQTVTYSESSFTPSEAIGLMGRKYNVNEITSGSWRGGLCSLKCYGDDHFGTLVAEFNPCYYQGNFGFWDTVSEQFLTGNVPGNIGGFGSYWDTDGFYPNALNESSHSSYLFLVDDRGYHTSRDFEVPQGCTQVQMRVSSSTLTGNIPILMCMNSSKGYVDWYSYNAVDRVVTLPANTAYVRLSIPRSFFADAWLKDYTHGTYLWKGTNV